MFFSRNSVSLCCTSGWLTIVTPSIVIIPETLEYGAVACDFHGRRGVGATLARQPTARGPAATFKNFGQRQRGGVEPEPLPNTFGDAVEQRHRQRAPLHHQRRRNLMLTPRIFGVAKREHAAIDE